MSIFTIQRLTEELAEFLEIIHITFILFMREWRHSKIAKCYY